MIVLTAVRTDLEKHLDEGDIFNMIMRDQTGSEVILTETLKGPQIINYVATYRFADEDGTVRQFHLSGIFGDRDNLPRDIADAVRYDNLEPAVQRRFFDTCGANLRGKHKSESSGPGASLQPKRGFLRRLLGL